MKKILPIIIFTFVGFSSFGQIKITWKIEDVILKSNKEIKLKQKEVALVLQEVEYRDEKIDNESSRPYVFTKDLLRKTLMEDLDLERNNFEGLLGYCFKGYSNNIDLRSVTRPTFCD